MTGLPDIFGHLLMIVAPAVDQYFRDQSVTCDVFAHTPADSIAQASHELAFLDRQVARAVVLRDRDYVCMAVLPLDHLIDFNELKSLTHRDLKPVAPDMVHEMFPDCEAGSIPPFGSVYNMEAIYDVSLLNLPAVVFEAGNHRSLLRVTHDEFKRLVKNSQRGCFAVPARLLQRDPGADDFDNENPAFAELLATCRRLCPAPGKAEEVPSERSYDEVPALIAELLPMRDKSQTSVGDFVRWLEAHPDLADRILFYARSAMFSSGKPVDSLEHAVSRVMGFDLALSLAIGLTAMTSLSMQTGGRMGRESLLTHALLGACLALRLSQEITAGDKPDPALLFAAGVMRNLGYMVLGNASPARYFLFDKLVEANPDLPVQEFERLMAEKDQDINTTIRDHVEIGAGLLRAWGMPEEIVEAVAGHHAWNRDSDHSVYARLLFLSDSLLRNYGLGDAQDSELPEDLVDTMKLRPESLQQITRQFMLLSSDLHGMDLETAVQ